MGIPEEARLAAGTRLAHYEIQDHLGSGAMGTVYRAHDTSLDRWVAVKVLRPRLAEDPAIVERFVREARAAARANHPNLTHIYFVGDEAGSRFFAMEYVPGATFEEEVAQRGPMEIGRFVAAIVQAARGLAAAHAVGVVHRDVKPSNMMLLPDGTVKVTDFGLAKSLEGDVGASGGGMLLGTPTYMSPEQCRGRPVDVRTDVYALGLTAWFLLGGRPPYAAESLGQMLSDQMNKPLPSIREVRPELPPALDRVLAGLCEKDPEKRPATMDEVAALFEPFRPRPLEPATLAARASAFAIDTSVVIFLATFFAIAVALLESQVLHYDVLPSYVLRLVIAALFFASQYVLEAFLGTSLAKWLFNLEVVRADGAAPGRVALLLRFLLRFPLAAAFLSPVGGVELAAIAFAIQSLALLGGVVSFLVRGGRTFWDDLTKTRVVYRRAAS